MAAGSPPMIDKADAGKSAPRQNPISRSPTQNGESHRVLITATCIAVLVGFLFLCYICLIRRKRRNQEYDRLRKGNDDRSSTSSSRLYETAATSLPINPSLTRRNGEYTYEELESATQKFDTKNLIGEGGFGYVFRGKLMSGDDVAIKRLKEGASQGEDEFRSEIETLSQVRHSHIVTLLGYCIDGEERIVVYKLVPNSSLQHHLFAKDAPTLEWVNRMKIALGSAKGLAYLHESCSPRILHRDIKTSNILLENDFEAKVTDFGLARFAKDNESHVSTRVAGSPVYLAPEYRTTGQLTEKSDVYSFGILLLVIITGRKAQCLDTKWAKQLLRRGLGADDNFEELIDIRLNDEYDKPQLKRMAICAALSIYSSPPNKRPKMSQIVTILEMEGDPSQDQLNKARTCLEV